MLKDQLRHKQKIFGPASVEDTGCFIPDPGSDHFLIPGPRSRSNHLFIPDSGSYMKSGKQTYFLLILMLSGTKSYS
jgi:hypothetical protein